MQSKLSDELQREIEFAAKKAATIIEYGEYDAGPASSARMAQTSRIDPIQKEFYIKGATEWAQWKVKYDETQVNFNELMQEYHDQTKKIKWYEEALQKLHEERQQRTQLEKENDLITANFNELKERCDKMEAALNKIIEMNRQHASDEYGDAEKAETWGCVMVAREALALKENAPEAKLTPEQIAERKEAIEWYRNPEGKKENEAVEFAEWLRTFEPLDKQNGQWVLESQISSQQLYNEYHKNKIINEPPSANKIL